VLISKSAESKKKLVKFFDFNGERTLRYDFNLEINGIRFLIDFIIKKPRFVKKIEN
jgi:hypothetical protein